MGFFIAAGAIAFVAICLLIAGISMQKAAEDFQARMLAGNAEVVGYDKGERKNVKSLLVRIHALGDGRIYNCESGKIDVSQYPKGATANVLYASRVVAGMHVVDVQLRDNPPADRKRMGIAMKRIALAMLAAATILAAIGSMIAA